MPYEYPVAWRLCIAAAIHFHTRNGAYIVDPHLVRSVTYSSAQENEYFDWKDAQGDDARELAEKFITRFPEIVAEGHGRDWAYAGWLCELLGVLEQGDLLPFVVSEYYAPAPEALTILPIRNHRDSSIIEFPLPPQPLADTC